MKHERWTVGFYRHTRWVDQEFGEWYTVERMQERDSRFGAAMCAGSGRSVAKAEKRCLEAERRLGVR